MTRTSDASTRSHSAERAIAVMGPMGDGKWLVKIYGVTGHKRRLAVTARVGMEYVQRIAAAYCGRKDQANG